jgi:hypothetical protein
MWLILEIPFQTTPSDIAWRTLELEREQYLRV